MLEKLELSVCALRQHRCAERLHDLLDCDILSCELVFGGAAEAELSAKSIVEVFRACIPYETECAHANRLEVRVSGYSLILSSWSSSWQEVAPHTLKSTAALLASAPSD